MIMARYLGGLYGSMSGIRSSEDSVSVCSSKNLTDGVNLPEPILDQNSTDNLPISYHTSCCHNLTSWTCEDVEEDPHEDCDFGDETLRYVSKRLMEDEAEEKTSVFKESLALEATERLFYDIIGEKYPPGPPTIDRPLTAPENCCSPYENGCIDFNRKEQGRNYDVATLPTSQSFPNIFNNSECVLQFRRGFEEASKFLPNGNDLLVDKAEKRHADECFRDGRRGKKNSYAGDLEQEDGSDKQAAADQMAVTSGMFDLVLLCDAEERETALRESWKNETRQTMQQDGQSRRSGKLHGGKKGGKIELVDLRKLLTLCAQAVAASDRISANRQLKQIRQHSSPMGDGMQRLAHYFANALETRLAGSGPQIYKAIITKPSATDFLKVYHLYLAISPFMKVTSFFSNKTIAKAAENSRKVHVIDFGISFGFAWPSLIQRLSSRPGGPPKLRITGIDHSQPGFWPAQRFEETGRRLANYAKSFNVPLEFNALVKNFETVQIEDLKIENDEILVVRSRYRFKRLLDETVMAGNPRNMVLDLIRKTKPDVFIHAVVNAAFDTLFFMTRFREALFHYSALFDLLEENVPSNILERMLVEREAHGREIMNVLACEGLERIERPETYKQWQVRIERAGFRQVPLDQEIVKVAKERVKSCYHKDFLIDEDGQWLRQGWKGRIIYAMSSWKPS